MKPLWCWLFEKPVQSLNKKEAKFQNLLLYNHGKNCRIPVFLPPPPPPPDPSYPYSLELQTSINFIKPGCYSIQKSRSDKCILSSYIIRVGRKRWNTFLRWPQWSLWENSLLEKNLFMLPTGNAGKKYLKEFTSHW